jgi:tripartite-type tricarboxylate transporter receptor subunit TctC
MRWFALALCFAFSLAHAQEPYPTRGIRLVIDTSPGGVTDLFGRLMAEALAQKIGQTVFVDNKPGASGNLAIEFLVRSPPDGYTLNLGQLGSHVMNGAAYELPYDLLNDLDPVAIIAANPQVIVARSGMPANNLKELIAWLKANPDKASVATVGAGSPSHVSAVYFANATGARLNLVPYRGGGPAMQDLVGNQVDLMIVQVAEAVAQAQAGRLKAFAVTAKTRLPGALDIPTVDEAGLPGMHISGWFALFAPKGTPKPVIGKLNAAVVEALADADVRARLATLGQEIFPREQQTPEAHAAYHKAEIEKWWPIIKAANIKGE